MANLVLVRSDLPYIAIHVSGRHLIAVFARRHAFSSVLPGPGETTAFPPGCGTTSDYVSTTGGGKGHSQTQVVALSTLAK